VVDVLVGAVDLLVKLAGGLVNVLLDNGADTSGPVVAPAVLRQTLGVDNTSWTGRGIGEELPASSGWLSDGRRGLRYIR